MLKAEEVGSLYWLKLSLRAGYIWEKFTDYPFVATDPAFRLNYLPWEFTFYHYKMSLPLAMFTALKSTSSGISVQL